MNNSKNKQVKKLKKRVEFLEKQVDGLNKVVSGMLGEINKVLLNFEAFHMLDAINFTLFDWQASLRLRNNGVNFEDTDD